MKQMKYTINNYYMENSLHVLIYKIKYIVFKLKNEWNI